MSRGERIGRVSSEWFSRPADERYLSLSDLYAAVRCRTERSRTRTVESAAIRIEASRDDAERLALMLPGSDTPIAPTHWSFGQLAGLVGAPAAYLRQLPAPLAGINLQYGLTSHRAEQVKTLEIEDGRVELPGAGTAREAEASRQDGAGAVHRPRQRHRRGGLPVPAGCAARHAAEGGTERGLGSIADREGDAGYTFIGSPQPVGGQVHAPARQIVQRRSADGIAETLGEGRARHAGLIRKRSERPTAAGLRVHGAERPGKARVGQRAEPAGRLARGAATGAAPAPA